MQSIPTASRPISRARYRRHDFVSCLPISKASRYSRRNRVAGKCASCPRPSFGHYRCRTHRQNAATASQRARRGHPDRSGVRNLHRRQRYRKLRDLGYSPASARTWSSSAGRFCYAPPPDLVPAPTSAPPPPVLREPPPPSDRPQSRLEIQDIAFCGHVLWRPGR
jgi:hypothetical protein